MNHIPETIAQNPVKLQNQMTVRSKSVYPVKKLVNVNLELPSHLQLVEKVGQGSFGEIYKIYNTRTKTLQACKVEFKDQRQNPQQQHLLPREFRVLQTLADSSLGTYQLLSSQEYNIIIMPYYGYGNLEELRKKQANGKFSKRTILFLAQAMIQAIEQLHQKNFVHRDIKPENFIVGSQGNHHKIFLIDFGLAKSYMDDSGFQIKLQFKSGNHIPMTQNKGMVGTARYTSINSHRGLEQSRRDDLEAIGYVLLYLYLGQVPWQNFPLPYQTRQEKFQKICEEKVTQFLSTLVNKLKFSSNQIEVDCPQELRKFFDYVRVLLFDQKPDYLLLNSFFIPKQEQSISIIIKQRYCFDWCPKNCTIIRLENECDLISNEVPYLMKHKMTQQATESTTDRDKKTALSKITQIQDIVYEQSKAEDLLDIPEEQIQVHKVLQTQISRRLIH